MNKVFLMGNLGDKIDLKYGRSGKPFGRMRLATTERFKNRDGEWEDRPEWHSLIVFGPRAEGLAKNLNKGDRILVEGRLQTRSWDDRDGVRRYVTEVIVRDVEFARTRGRLQDEPNEEVQPETTSDDFDITDELPEE